MKKRFFCKGSTLISTSPRKLFLLFDAVNNASVLIRNPYDNLQCYVQKFLLRFCKIGVVWIRGYFSRTATYEVLGLKYRKCRTGNFVCVSLNRKLNWNEIYLLILQGPSSNWLADFFSFVFVSGNPVSFAIVHITNITPFFQRKQTNQRNLKAPLS